MHRLSLHRAAVTVNRLHVLRNWAVGCLVVEYEQNGVDRAAYGQEILKNLSDDLQATGITGLGLTTLTGCRSLYRLYPQIGQPAADLFPALPGDSQKGQPPVGQSMPSPDTGSAVDHLPVPLPAAKVLEFSWSHLLELIRLDDPWKRAF